MNVYSKYVHSSNFIDGWGPFRKNRDIQNFALSFTNLLKVSSIAMKIILQRVV